MAPFCLLDLPLELVEDIVLHLEPREAIYLSLTCRQLYHGPLSPRNSRLWYLVGNFASGSLPGHNLRWQTTSVLLPDSPSPQAIPAPQVILERFLGINAHKPPAPVYMGNEELRDLAKIFPAQPGKPVVDYRRLLVDTMLGLTETGCQWCLSKPDTDRHYLFPVVKGRARVCEDCFRFNAIPIGCLNLIPGAIKFPASKVQPYSCPKSENFFDPNGHPVALLWKSYVNRLLRENYCYRTGVPVELKNIEDESGRKLKRGKKMMKTRVFSCKGGWCGVVVIRAPCPQTESTFGQNVELTVN